MSDIRAAVDSVRFTPVRLREGYDMGEVDDLLDRVAKAADAGEPLAPLVAGARFSRVRLREGYDMGEVDTFLAQVASGAVSAAPADPPAGPVDPASQRMADGLRAVRFSAVRLREGYDMGEVDALLDRLVAAVLGGEDMTPVVTAARLTRVRVREGYDIGEVDDFLAHIARGATREAAPTYDGVVQEQRGLLRRLRGR